MIAARAVTALLDIGNTRIKLGWVRPDTGEREPAVLAVDHDEHRALLPWLAHQGLIPVSVLGVNVAGEALAQTLEAGFRSAGAGAVRWLQGEAQAAGVTNAYLQPARLGPDRWAAMLGLAGRLAHDRQIALLASFGTATTLDTLSPAAHAQSTPALPGCEWVYEGGLILPGAMLMRQALASGTARLPEAQGPAHAFPRHTHQAIASGVVAAQAGAVLRQWLAAWQRYGSAPAVFCTGGAWPLVADEVRALLRQTAALAGLAAPVIHEITSPILDGLARLAGPDAGPGTGTQSAGSGSRP
ncbi:MAG: type III pantothenate kinase [Castellaniella sp.]